MSQQHVQTAREIEQKVHDIQQNATDIKRLVHSFSFYADAGACAVAGESAVTDRNQRVVDAQTREFLESRAVVLATELQLEKEKTAAAEQKNAAAEQKAAVEAAKYAALAEQFSQQQKERYRSKDIGDAGELTFHEIANVYLNSFGTFERTSDRQHSGDFWFTPFVGMDLKEDDPSNVPFKLIIDIKSLGDDSTSGGKISAAEIQKLRSDVQFCHGDFGLILSQSMFVGNPASLQVVSNDTMLAWVPAPWNLASGHISLIINYFNRCIGLARERVLRSIPSMARPPLPAVATTALRETTEAAVTLMQHFKTSIDGITAWKQAQLHSYAASYNRLQLQMAKNENRFPTTDNLRVTAFPALKKVKGQKPEKNINSRADVFQRVLSAEAQQLQLEQLEMVQDNEDRHEFDDDDDDTLLSELKVKKKRRAVAKVRAPSKSKRQKVKPKPVKLESFESASLVKLEHSVKLELEPPAPAVE
jgi:hypothetical protein